MDNVSEVTVMGGGSFNGETDHNRIAELMERRRRGNSDSSGPEHYYPATSIKPQYGRGLMAATTEVGML